jgi:hypothetical protein
MSTELLLLVMLLVFTTGQAQSHSVSASSSTIYTEAEIVSCMQGRSRAYFPFLFRDGGFRSGMEVGVADGRYSELFLRVNRHLPSWKWHMVEPFPNYHLHARYPLADVVAPVGKKARTTAVEEAGRIRKNLNWENGGIGKNAFLYFYPNLSTDSTFIASIDKLQLDFLYLDGAHDYKTVKEELHLMWRNVRPGGVMAGHDYCNYGEPSLDCLGCFDIPRCVKYTPYGVAHGKSAVKVSVNQHDVVRAVQEWLVESQPNLRLYHTYENFTKDSLEKDHLHFNLVLTNSYNPSWFVVKPI